MATIIDIPTFSDNRGELSILEKVEGFDIKRIYYIYATNGKMRGQHRHKKTRQILVSINGTCEVTCQYSNKKEETFSLDSPTVGLIVEPEDWHSMQNFSHDCILLVLASEYFDPDDYIDERY